MSLTSLDRDAGCLGEDIGPRPRFSHRLTSRLALCRSGVGESERQGIHAGRARSQRRIDHVAER
jgi:hypothetical protein